MKYVLAKIEKDKGKTIKINCLCEILENEFIDFMSSFDILEHYGQIRDLYEICVDTYEELEKFLSSSYIEELLLNQLIPPRKIAQIANRLLVNYCSAMYLFVNKTPRYLRKYVPEDLVDEQFVKLTNEMYDDEKDRAYCFFSKMRNYIIHNKLPFTKIVGDIRYGHQLVMSKKELSKDNNWGPSKAILQTDGDELNIAPMLESCSIQITVLYYGAMYCLATYLPTISDKIRYFREKYGVSIFEFISYESVDELRNGNCALKQVPWDSLQRMVDDINKTPGVTINYV